MHLTLDGSIQILSEIVTLGAVAPLLNGQPVAGAVPEIMRQERDSIALRFTGGTLEGGEFGIQAERDERERWWLRYWLAGLPETVELDSFGLRFGPLLNLRAYLRNGYHSWDGTYYVGVDAAPAGQSVSGYAMIQLLPRRGTGSLVLGFDRHDRFQQTFTVGAGPVPPVLDVLTLWDRRDRSEGRCESERLVIFEHDGVEDGLRAWAEIVAAAMSAPPRPALPITGWCSWYNLYAYVTEENILEHLRDVAAVAQREGLPMRVFQIDDGFTPEMGDWLEVKPEFPRGMAPLLADIQAAGFIPGLWIGPFMVGNRSHLFRDHPDWVVQDRQSGGPLVQWRLYGENRWHKRSEEYYVLDATHPDALDYIRHVLRTWRDEWGCQYFKTDFMYFGSEHGPERARWHTPGLTRIEVWRRMAETIRDAIGEALWLCCGSPLWAVAGLTDAVRIGSDVGVTWHGQLSAQSLLRDQATRNFTNRILWQIDPDCILLRDRYHHLTEAEVRSLAIYAGMTGGLVMTSDELGSLPAERLRLWRLLVDGGPGECRFPFLGQTDYVPVTGGVRPLDPALVEVRQAAPGANGMAAVFVFNTGDSPIERTYPLAELGLPAPAYVFDWIGGQPWPAPVDRISVTLAPHDGRLLFTAAQPFSEAPIRLP